MLRRALAFVLSVALALVALPCASSAPSVAAAHDCCASTAHAEDMGCCNSATPRPATAPMQDAGGLAVLHDAASSLNARLQLSAYKSATVAVSQPAKRIPATILRT